MTEPLDHLGICNAVLLPDSMRCTADQFVAITTAAAAAGHDSVAVRAHQAATVGLPGARRLLDDLGLTAGPVEAAFRWDAGPGPSVVDEAAPLADAAHALGARGVVACVLGPTVDPGAARDGFAALCQALDPLQVSLEFLPWTGVPTLAAAWDLVQGAGAPNGGILLDAWHWHRQPGGPDLELLRRIPGEKITYLQLGDADATAAADLFAEAMTARVLPGTGAVDLAALLGVLDEIGARPEVASEIFSTELAALGPDEAARRMYAACAALR